MEFVSNPIVALLILIGILVFGHELGHYLIGRMCGIAVEIFSIGFGPPIFRWYRGKTEYRISLLPLGGFVKFYGSVPSEPVPEEVKGKEFHAASPFKRALTIAAGPVANLLIAVVAYALTGFSGIPHQPPVVGQVLPQSVAETVGIKSGDRVLAIEGKKIATWEDMQRAIASAPKTRIQMTLERGREAFDLYIVPEAVDVTPYPGAKKKEIGRIGIDAGLVPPIIVATQSSGAKSIFRIFSFQLDGSDPVEIKSFPAWVDMVLHYAQQHSHFDLVLNVGDVSSELADKDLSFSLSNISSAKELLQTMNVDDAQMVIGESRESEGSRVLEHGDFILAVNGQPMANVFAFRQFLSDNSEAKLKLTVQNLLSQTPEREVTVSMLPREVQTPAGKEIVYLFPGTLLGQGVPPEPFFERYKNPFAALWYGTKETARMSAFLVKTIAELVTGETPLASLGGPILIAKVASESAKRGWVTFMTTLALISVNLAMINLLPIPAFDGGQLIVVGLEAIRRRPLPEVAIENFQKIGFVMILILMFLATYNDVKRVWISKL